MSAAASSKPAWYARFRPTSRDTRRRVVVTFVSALVLTAVAGWLQDAPFLRLVALFAALGLGVALRASVHSTADLPDEQLDERLIRERDAAFLISYQLIAAVAVVAAIGLEVVVPLLERWPGGEVADPRRFSGALFFTIPPMVLFIPSAVLAWRRQEV